MMKANSKKRSMVVEEALAGLLAVAVAEDEK